MEPQRLPMIFSRSSHNFRSFAIYLQPMRLCIQHLLLGELVLDDIHAHRVRDVMRLAVGAELELFDTSGQTAEAHILRCSTAEVALMVRRVVRPASASLRWTMASAVPKGPRADWMIEKLSELGATSFVPLITARSVVHPEGAGKSERWRRLAVQAASQSKRNGVMMIESLQPLANVVRRPDGGVMWYLSTAAGVQSIAQAVARVQRDQADMPRMTLFIGPEGGWAPEEIALFERSGLTAVALTATILRVETAAIVAAAVVASFLTAPAGGSPDAAENTALPDACRGAS